ncbi:MAG TPA: hypothetical protein PLT30_14795 [Deltaproteobacteria bacterium]|nr:hypothetical protein [Deltaproteobacteria bacterium]
MKWFKHLSGSLNDSLIYEAIETFGSDAYLVFFGTLEHLADDFDISNPGIARLSIKKLTKNMQLSRLKLVKILQHFDKIARENPAKTTSFFAEVDGDHVTINCPKFVGLKDNHTTNEARKTCKSLASDLEVTFPYRSRSRVKSIDIVHITKSHPNGCDSPVEPDKVICPHNEIVDLYHQLLPSLPRVVSWHDTRQKYLRSRWQERPERQNLQWWSEFFNRVSRSDFLMGRVPPKNGGKPFKADLEWLVRPLNLTKVLEGRYDNTAPRQPQQRALTAEDTRRMREE